MRAKEVFLEAYQAQQKIKQLEQRRQHYIAMATSLSGMSEVNIRSTEKRSRTESAAIGLVETADRLGLQLEHYVAAVRVAEEIIARIEKPRYRDVLSLHYLQGLSWREVSERMHYRDEKSVFRVHGWALLEAEKIISCR